MSSEASGYGADFMRDPELAERILREFAPAPAEAQRVIRCSRENVDRAVARAITRAVVLGKAWSVEIEE